MHQRGDKPVALFLRCIPLNCVPLLGKLREHSLRDFGKTKKSLRTVHLPEGLANELWLWKQECRDSSAEVFIFPNARKRSGAKKNGFIRSDNYRARVLKKLAEKLGVGKAEFPGAAAHDGDAGLKRRSGVKGYRASWDTARPTPRSTSTCSKIEESVKQTQGAIYREPTARPLLVKTS